MPEEKPIYFKSLNGIRAIASLLVVVWHTDQFSGLFKVMKIGFHVNGMAGNAVDMFFVLSGFLITYLLLAEKEKTNTINLKNFYLRRIFRIWPLYYISIMFSLILVYFGIVPGFSDIMYSTFLYVFLAANVAYVLNLAISSITPLWSVGVEEQFYLIWPQIVKRTRRYIGVFVGIFIFFLVLKLSAYLVFTPKSALYKFFSITRIDIMCLGALGAYLVYSRNKLLKLIYRKEAQIVAWLVLLISIIYKPIHIFSFIDREVNAIFYLIIILNVSSNEKSMVSLENVVMNFLGKISYGVYVYHMIVIYLLSTLLLSAGFQPNHILMFPMVLLGTILIAWLSYKYFELPFLRVKNKYAVIKSTNTR